MGSPKTLRGRAETPPPTCPQTSILLRSSLQKTIGRHCNFEEPSDKDPSRRVGAHETHGARTEKCPNYLPTRSSLTSSMGNDERPEANDVGPSR